MVVAKGACCECLFKLCMLRGSWLTFGFPASSLKFVEKVSPRRGALSAHGTLFPV